jgi:hypothetical protein
MRLNLLFVIVSSTFILQVETFAQENTSFLEPPKIFKNPENTQGYSAESRKFTGIPSLAISRRGRMWATWYAGVTPAEDSNNYVVVVTSGDGGETWKEVLAIDPDGPGPARSYDPEIWIDPDGTLWVFWAQAMAHTGAWSLIKDGTLAGVWAITTKKPDTGTPRWSKPRRLTDGVMMCKPVVLSGGEWILPASMWNLAEGSARMVVSTDLGKSWHVKGAATIPPDVRRFDEHMIIERKDHSLWMLVRTIYGIGESTSVDNGHSWSPLSPSIIKHPSARFFIRRLNSGNLLLVKHGPIDKQTDRSQLMAYISENDGLSWSGGLLLDERAGVSYPDGQQVEDGTIYIIYDYNRKTDQQILMAGFREEDVISGNPDSETVSLRRLVSKGGQDRIKN